MAIGKYPLSIGNFDVPNVSRLQVYKFTRHETRSTSFAGSDRVDRSQVKYKIIANVAFCTAATMQTLVQKAEQITQNVVFPDGTNTVNKTMIFDIPQPGQPIYKFGNSSNGVYYQNLQLVMEEA